MHSGPSGSVSLFCIQPADFSLQPFVEEAFFSLLCAWFLSFKLMVYLRVYFWTLFSWYKSDFYPSNALLGLL